MNKLKKILACMIITLGILYLPEIHANASTVTIDEATFPGFMCTQICTRTRRQ